MITMIVNGEATTIQSDITISELLKIKQIESPEMVSVELNEEIIPRQEYSSKRLKQNDRVEFMYFMGGGAAL